MEKIYVNSDKNNKWYGIHYLLDFYGVDNIFIPNEADYILNGLKTAAVFSEATILHSYIHEFGNGGYSGVVVLEESHISIHTWPEDNYISIDIYMCGNCFPERAYFYLLEFFQPTKHNCEVIKRGLIPKITVE